VRFLFSIPTSSLEDAAATKGSPIFVRVQSAAGDPGAIKAATKAEEKSSRIKRIKRI